MRAAMTGLLTLTICAVSQCAGAEVKELVAKLRDADSDVRRAAAKGLAELGAEAKPAVPDLVKATADRDLFVRRFAAEALGNVGPDAKAAVAPLARLLGDEKPEVQLAAVEALPKLGPASVAALTAAVKDPNRAAAVRKKAAQGLAAIGPEARKAVPALTDVLTGRIASPKAPRKGKNLEDDDVRLDAAAALGAVAKPEDKAAVAALKSVSEGKQRNRALQKAARESLRKISEQSKKKGDD
ncbi:MAG: HEAT repeat domain-containing protein [Gemmataceae bacterium]